MTVSRIAFYRAVATGDLDVIEAYWAQPNVQAHVQETEAFITTTEMPHAAFLRDRLHPWYYTQQSWDPFEWRGFHYPEFLFGVAVDRGQAHVIQWLFTQDHIGATLKLLLPIILHWAQWSHPDSVEVLLTSSTFVNSITPDRQQHLLDNAISNCSTPAVADVLVAHGARVNAPDGPRAVRHAADIARFALVRRLEILGAFVIGVPDLEEP